MHTAIMSVGESEEVTLTHSDESSTPLNNISSLSGEISTQEQLKICCKPTYRMRRLRNGGAIMLLVWNYLLTSVYFFNVTLRDSTSEDSQNYGLFFTLQLVAGGLTLPIAGWLADVYIGRYKVIRFSMWIMWIFYALVSANAVVEHLVEGYETTSYVINNVLMTVVIIALAAFQANIIQFGIDQLHDASTDEITSFIVWYIWTCYASGLVVQLTFKCVPSGYRIVGMLVTCVHLSLALCLLLTFNNLLVKEPVTQNPFKLVYSVIRFAIKNKFPLYRSAFTYCEDELPSRIDFGKCKYGGPFTTEQVEDVKTFLRLVSVIAVISISFGEMSASDSLMHKTLHSLSVDESVESTSKCYSMEGFIYISIYSWVLVLPFYEVILYPILHRFLVILKTQVLLMMGVALLIMTVLSLTVIDIMARHYYFKNNVNTTAVKCADVSTLSTSMDYRWMALPYVCRSVSVALFTLGSIQFIVAQTPYSMRGLIMGAAYGLLFLSGALGIAINVPFSRNLTIWGTGIISCGFWQAVLILGVEIVAVITLYLIFRKYKGRKREDVLPNEHIFAERYYDRDS